MLQKGQLAIVTGANRGLGRGCAEALYAKGLDVAVCARSVRKAEATVVEIEKDTPTESGEVKAFELDVSDGRSIDSFLSKLFSDSERVPAVLINNAGIFPRSAGLAAEPDELAEAYTVNTLGPFRLIKEILPRMNKAGFGRIVNVSSGMGGIAEMQGGFPAYRLSKAALNALTKVAAAEASGDVKVNSVCPGWVQTEMGGANATRSIAEGVRSILWAAELSEDGPNGGFFRDGKALAW